MSNQQSVRPSGRYVVTQLGHDAMDTADRCVCLPTIDGGLFVCHNCGTIWASLNVDLHTFAAIAQTHGKP